MVPERFRPYGEQLEYLKQPILHEYPPRALLTDIFRRDIESLPRRKQYIVAWTAAVAAAFERSGLWQGIPGYKFSAIGLADPQFEDLAFAVIVYVDPVTGKRNRFELKVGSHTIPVFSRPASVFHHSTSIHPLGGRTTCVASSPSFAGAALVTAKHVLDAQLGRPAAQGDMVQLLDSSGNKVNGSVLVQTPGQIDGAVIEPWGGMAASGSRLSVETYVAMWDDVEMMFPRGPESSKVLSVTDTRGSMDPRLDIRIFFGNSGLSGDSGTLIMDGSKGKGVAIYSGEITNMGGIDEGYGQHLGQVADAMGLKLLTG